jgi:hypothetical protein
MKEQLQELSQYKHKYKNTQEQIETLRFDNEHLQKDIAEKDLQIAGLKNVLCEHKKAYIQLDLSRDKTSDLEKEKDYWRAIAKSFQRENDAYKKLLSPIMEYAQTQSKT